MKTLLILLTIAWSVSGYTQDDKESDTTLLTIFLKHDQTKNLNQIGKILDKNKFFQTFPPKGTKVVSWYVMMGIGQVVTLDVPPHLLREVNLAIERGAWGSFKTEFYPTYNLYPHLKEKLKNKSTKKL